MKSLMVAFALHPKPSSTSSEAPQDPASLALNGKGSDPVHSVEVYRLVISRLIISIDTCARPEPEAFVEAVHTSQFRGYSKGA
jgi:hypothetical protein